MGTRGVAPVMDAGGLGRAGDTGAGQLSTDCRDSDGRSGGGDQPRTSFMKVACAGWRGGCLSGLASISALIGKESSSRPRGPAPSQGKRLLDFSSEFPVSFGCLSLPPKRSFAPEKSLSLQGEVFCGRVRGGWVGRREPGGGGLFGAASAGRFAPSHSPDRFFSVP